MVTHVGLGIWGKRHAAGKESCSFLGTRIVRILGFLLLIKAVPKKKKFDGVWKANKHNLAVAFVHSHLLNMVRMTLHGRTKKRVLMKDDEPEKKTYCAWRAAIFLQKGKGETCLFRPFYTKPG